MKYNLTPLIDTIDETIPSYKEWQEKIDTFFMKSNSPPETLDMYYNFLVNNSWVIKPCLQEGYLVDDYSGLFTLNTPHTRGIHTFNLANFVRRNHQHFYKKKIRTITMDYGMLNLQLKLCGLELTTVFLPLTSLAGAILTMIGNKVPTYDVKASDNMEEENVIFASCIFNTDEQAYDSWNMLLDEHIKGKEVYFSTQTFNFLQNHILYDRIEQVEDPHKIYDGETYRNLDYGFQNKIYRIVG